MTIFHSTFVSVWGCILCRKIVFKSITGAICILIHPLGKVGREEGCSPPRLLAVKVRCGPCCPKPRSGGVGDPGAQTLGVCSSPSPCFWPGSVESALSSCPQRNGVCQPFKILPPAFPSHAFRQWGRGNQKCEVETAALVGLR